MPRGLGVHTELMLGALVLLGRYGHASEEAIGAYVLHHLARHQPAELERWPRAAALAASAARGDEPAARLSDVLGSGPDPFAKPGAAPSDDFAPCAAERHALSLLHRVAVDLRLEAYGRGGERVVDTAGAAGRIIALLRAGQLGDVCFDASAPSLELERRGGASESDAGARRKRRPRTRAQAAVERRPARRVV